MSNQKICPKCQDQAWVIVEVENGESVAIICDCPKGQLVKEGLKMKKELIKKKRWSRFNYNQPDFKKAAADDGEAPF